MNKKILFLLFLFTLNLLNASTLLKFYHRDYQVADRSVFVFDSKPDFEYAIKEQEIVINFPQTLADYGLKNEEFTETNVLKSFAYTVSDDDLIVKLNLLNSGSGKPGLESFHFSQNKQQYKVVFDIIKKPKPTSENEAKQLAKFYRLVGKEQKAARVLSDFSDYQAQLETEAAKISDKQVAEKKLSSASATASEQMVKSAVPDSSTSQQTNVFFNFLQNIPATFYLLLLIAIILIILTVRIFSYVRRKKRKISSDQFWYPTSGFASDQCQKKIVSILHKHNWESETIARELQLSNETVEKIIAELETK